MRRCTIRLGLVAALIFVIPRLAIAANPLVADAKVTKSALALGERADITLTVVLEPGWHVNAHEPKLDYLIPTSVEFELPEGVTAGRVEYPEPVTRTLRFLSEQTLELYEGTFVIRSTVVYEKIATPSPLAMLLRYQACNDTICLRPTMIRVPLEIETLGADRHVHAQPFAVVVPASDVAPEGLPFVAFTTDNYDAARRSKAPFVIEFAADWCAPCNEMKRRTFRDPAVLAAAHGMAFLSVDMTEPDDYVARVLRSFDVIAAPTTIFFDAQGKELHRKGGFIGPADFVRLLRESWQSTPDEQRDVHGARRI